MSLKRCMLALFVLLPMAAQAEISVETLRLGHGVRGWYARSESVPVVHVAMSFEGAGSISDPAERAGRAMMVAAMLTEGAGGMDAVAFQRALEDKAIDLSISASDDRLRIDVHCLREHAAAAGQLLATALAQPHFAPADLARVKTQALSQLQRLEESPVFQASRAFEEKAFAGHPYAAEHYGSPASLKVMAAQDLRDYMGTYITRGNVLVSAAGDVDRSLLRDMLGPVIDALGASDAGPVPAASVAMQGANEALDVAMDVPQSTVVFAAPALPRSDKRFYAMYLLNDILGGNGLTSRLADGLRQKKGLVYGVSTSLDERDGISLLRGALATRTETATQAGDAVRALLREMATRGVTTQECDDARTHVLGAFPLQLDGSRNMATMLLVMRMYGLGEDYIETRQEKFASVTCAEVNALAKEFLVPERFLFVTAGRTP
jgi:zinc protease